MGHRARGFCGRRSLCWVLEVEGGGAGIAAKASEFDYGKVGIPKTTHNRTFIWCPSTSRLKYPSHGTSELVPCYCDGRDD